MCRYSYGYNRCAHHMVSAGECAGERNCLERVAPSYHSRPLSPRTMGEGRETPGLGPHVPSSLYLVDLGAPLISGRGGR